MATKKSSKRANTSASSPAKRPGTRVSASSTAAPAKRRGSTTPRRTAKKAKAGAVASRPAAKKGKKGTARTTASRARTPSKPAAVSKARSAKAAKVQTKKHAKAKPMQPKTPVSPRPARGGAGSKAAAASARPRAKAIARPTPASPKTPSRSAPSPVRRRDGAGHLDSAYAADLLARTRQSKRQEPEGFVRGHRSNDDLAENLGEEFLESATSGENREEELLDETVPEESGGPFVQSTAGAEFADGTDASNPKGSKREPFPTT